MKKRCGPKEMVAGAGWVVLSLVLLLAASRVGSSGAWYVSPGGDDGNDCQSPSSPCQTIDGAIGKAAVAGDTIYVASGRYTGVGEQVVQVNREIDLVGGWNKGFTAQDGVSTLDGEDERVVLRIEFSHGGLVENFVIQNGRGDGASGIVNYGGITLRNCTVRNNVDIGDWTSEGAAFGTRAG